MPPRAGDITGYISSNSNRCKVVELSHMSHRILAGYRLDRHWPVGRDQARSPVAAPNFAIVAHLCRGSRYREKQFSSFGAVSHIHGDTDIR